MEKWKYLIIPMVIINFVLTLILFSYLIVSSDKKEEIKGNDDNKTDIIGFVKEISARTNGITMLVESNDDTSAYDKAYITVTNDTFITKTIYSRTFKPEEINIGDLVEVKFIGPVRESYPVQADAKSVWIKESSVE